MKIKKKQFNRWWPVFAWCGLIFFLSSQTLPPPSGNFFADVVFPYLAHLFEFGVLFLLVYRAAGTGLFSLVFCFVYALSDEFHQAMVPSRTPSMLDVTVDVVGALLAWSLVKYGLNYAPGTIKKLAKKVLNM